MSAKDILTWLNPSIDRRKFLKVSGALAATTTIGVGVNFARTKKNKIGKKATYGENSNDAVETADDIIYSVCQMCHARCGIRCRVIDGVLVKIDGNPYHPNNLDIDQDGNAERLTYSTPTTDAFKTIGTLCIKGQAGIQTVYDPFRIQQPLKRAGNRGEGKWQAISWETAFSEIATAIKEKIDFDKRNTEYIDEDVHELGYLANLLVFSPGRSTEKKLTERLFKYAWGTQNYDMSHTSICEVSRHVANELITWKESDTGKTPIGTGRTQGWQPDILGTEYIIYFGSNPLEAGFPMNGMSRNLMHFKRNGGRFVVIDPRFNNSAAKANEWVPINPGTDAALALAMARWIIENKRHNTTYLSNPNSTTASGDSEKTWTDSTYLVGNFTDSSTGKEYKRYIRKADITSYTINTSTDDDYVVSLSDGTIKGIKDVGTSDSPVLEASGTIDGITYKSAFLLYKEQSTSKSLAEWSTICGVSESTIKRLANEFTSHGKKAVAAHYRGPAKHTNGFYNVLAVQHLNTLIGNYDWKGGCSKGGGGWSETDSKDKTIKITGFKDTTADKSSYVKGMRIDRSRSWLYKPANTSWTETGSEVLKGFWAPNLADNLEANGKPKRPFFPFATHTNYQEVVPGIQDGYPYTPKVLFTYWNAWPYATPALKKVFEETFSDTSKCELFVAVSPVMGEVAAYADYVLPDTTYLEKFSFPGIPWRVNKGTSFQRPVVGQFDGKIIGMKTDAGGAGNLVDTSATNEYTPVLPNTKSAVDIWIGLANALGVGGFGENAIADGKHLRNSWDFAKVQLENVVSQHGATTIDEIVSKGGVFDNPGDEYSGDYLSYTYANIVRFFADPVARTRDSVTGEYWDGYPKYEEIKHTDGTTVSDAGYNYKLITYKTVNHGQARTIVNPWLMLPMSDNYVEISRSDGQTLGVDTGDFVKVTSASNTEGIKTRAKVTEGIMPGVVAISHHFGHWEMSSKPFSVDGSDSGYDSSRAAGVQPNLVMRADSLYSNVSLQDKIGSSVSFFDTWVKVERV